MAEASRNLLRLKSNEAYKMAVLSGDLSAAREVGRKILRVFISATSKDTATERNYLMREVYPELSHFCNQYGVQLSFVDLQSGANDDLIVDYLNEEICQAEIDRCFHDSIPGPCFIFLSTNVYGKNFLPCKIGADTLKNMMEEVVDQESKHLIYKWYKLDENAVPPEYILQSFHNQESQKDRERENRHGEEEKALLFQILRDSAMMSSKLSNEQKHDWEMSTTEKEVKHALSYFGTNGWQNRYILLVRDIIHDNENESKESRDFIDDDQSRIRNLRKFASDKMTVAGNFKVSLHEGRISESSHADYLYDLGSRLKKTMENLIRRTFEDLPPNDDLTTEVATHLLFCLKRASSFYGRGLLVTGGLKYFKKDDSHKSMLVVHGVSGSGKTSLIAKLAVESKKQLADAYGYPPLLITRFCGRTPQSSSSYLVMRSICQQIAFSLNKESPPFAVKYDDMIENFAQHLSFGEIDRPILLFIDSIDELSDDDQGRCDLKWLPDILPPHVYVVVSTLARNSGCLRSLQEKNIPKDNFLEVKNLSDEDCSDIFGSLLNRSKRLLTPHQLACALSLIKDTSQEKSTILKLHLVFDIAVKWNSYDLIPNIPTSVAGIIDHLLINLEKSHGEKLISTVVGLMVTSNHGLCETDLLALLSSLEDVLKEIESNHHQPITMIPPLCLALIRHDLQHYIIDSGAYGKYVWSWSHIQFSERAKVRYLQENRKIYANMLRDYLSGEMCKHSRRNKQNISPQPLYWENSEEEIVQFNKQKLSELPMVTLKGTDPSQVERFLCDFQFISAKIKAGYGRELLSEYREALRLASSPRIREYSLFICSEIHVLEAYPRLILQQALNMPNSSSVAEEAERAIKDPQLVLPWESGMNDDYLVRYVNKPVGGQPCLMTLQGQSKSLRILKFWNERFVVCLCFGNQLNIWDINVGENLKSISVPVNVDNFDIRPIPISLDKIDSGSLEEGVSTADIACACENGDIYLWRVTVRSTASVVLMSRWNAHSGNSKGMPISLAFTDIDGDILATGMTADVGFSYIKLWDLSEVSPSRYQHPMLITNRSANDLCDGKGNCGVVALQFALNNRFLIIGLIGAEWNLIIVFCSIPTLKSKLMIRYKDYACPYFDIYETFSPQGYVLISLVDASGESSDVALVTLEIQENGDLKGRLDQVPSRGSCRFLGTSNEIVAVTKERLALFSLYEFNNNKTKTLLPWNQELEWKKGPFLELQEINSVVLPFLHSTQATDLPLIGHSHASRWDIFAAKNVAAIGSRSDIIKLWSIEKLRTQKHPPTHDSRVELCLKIPNSSNTITCSKVPFPTTKVWDSEAGVLLKSFANEGASFAAYSRDYSRILYIRETPRERPALTSLTMHVVDSKTFMESMKSKGFPDSLCSVCVKIPCGKLEEVSFSDDNNFVRLHYFTGGDVYIVSLARKTCVKLPLQSDQTAAMLQTFTNLSLYKPAFFQSNSKSLVVWNHPNESENKLAQIAYSKWNLEGGCVQKGLFPENKCWVVSLYQVLRCVAAEFTRRKAMIFSSQVDIERLFYFSGSCALPEAGMVAVSTHDGFLQLRDSDTFKVQKETATHDRQVSILRVTPNLKYIVTCSHEGWVRIWDLVRLKEVGVYHNDIAITSLDVFVGVSDHLVINIGDHAGQFKVLDVRPIR